VHIGDSLLGSTGVVPGPFGDAGEVAEIAVSFTAPTEPGTYRSRWQLRSPDGELFGTRPYVQGVVAGGGFDESCIPVVPSVLDTLEEDLGGLLTGTATFESACEFHNWSFPGEAGQQVTISVIPVGSPGVQAGFRLFGDNTTLLADTGLSANPSETLVLPDTTTYVLHVFADGSNVYNIVVEPEGGSAP
ncbi:MAG: NBR1-Ig-like domain-containing protein, partial [Anaerolineae bacterium]